MTDEQHRFNLTTSAESTFGSLADYETVSDGQLLAFQVKRRRRPAAPSHKVIDAVFGHIQAMRALGHTSLNTADIAKALSLPQSQVDHAVRQLSTKGVKAGA